MTKATQMKPRTTHTHTHNRFTALLEYVRDHPGEQVPEGKTRKVKTNLDLLEPRTNKH